MTDDILLIGMQKCRWQVFFSSLRKT